MAKKTIFWQGWLVDNPLTEDPNDFTLKVKTNRMITTDDIARALVAEGTEFKYETLADILQRGDRIVRENLVAGNSVSTGVFYAYPSMPGVWHSVDDTYDDAAHQAGVNFQLNAQMREALKQVRAEVLGIAPTGPQVSLCTDTWSGEVNGLITPGEALIIRGRALRITGDSEDNGVRFVRVDNGTATAADPRRLTVNNPTQLQLRVPDLAPGDYWLEITTQFSNGTTIKEPRTVRFDKVLNVPAPAEEPEPSAG